MRILRSFDLGLAVSGHTSIMNFWSLFTILYMTMPIGPVYIVILILRKRIFAVLERAQMSDKTKATHKQLVKVRALICGFTLLLMEKFAHTLVCYDD